MSLRAATVRGLVRSPSAGVFSGADDQWNPRMLPDLAAWFDALDVSTMLSGDGSTITDGGAVALWGDKSGNSGVNCLVLDGSNSNNATTPYAAAFAGNEIDVDIDCAANAFAATQTLIGQWDTARWIFQIGADQKPILAINDGTSNFVYTATAAAGFSVYVRGQYRATRNATTGDVTFYTRSTSASAWAQLGDVVSGTTNALRVSATIMRIGSNAGTSQNFNGKIYACNYRTSIGGAAVFTADFSTAGKKLANGDTFVCATGQTVTLNSSGATGARIAGERDLFQGTLANRPVYLNYAGVKYGYLNGVASNSFLTPASAAIQIAADIDFVSRVSFDAMPPAAFSGLLTRDDAGAGQSSYRFYVRSGDGYLTLGLTNGGTTFTDVNSGAIVPFTKGWLRATWRQSDGRVQFFQCADQDSVPASNQWTQLGTDKTIAIASIKADGTYGLTVGARFNGAQWNLAGRIYRAQIYDGIGGTLKADFNPALYTSGTTFTASTGEVWTINGGAHIVTRSGLYFDGSNDYLKTAAFSLSQPETVYFTGSQISWTLNDTAFDGGSVLSGALFQASTTPGLKLYAGSTGTENAGLAVQTAGTISSVFNNTSPSLRINRGAATTGIVGTAAMNGLTVGVRGDGTSNPANIFVSEVAIYSAAHATATQDRWAIYSGRRHSFAS